MDVTGKPIPLPRKTGKKYNCDPPQPSFDNDDNQNSSPTIVPIVPDVPPPKPVPLPRKLVKRLSKCEEEKIEENDDDEDDYFPPPLVGDKGFNKLSDDDKRLTLNIFRRKIDNPFGTEFEESLRDVQPLKLVASPFEEVPQDVWTRFSNSFEPTEDFDKISVDPPSSSSTHHDHVSNRNSSTDASSSSSTSMPEEWAVNFLPKSTQRLEKIVSCPGAPETSTSSRNSSSTDTSESVYEAISSYSSEPKLSELVPNQSTPPTFSVQGGSNGSSKSFRSNGISTTDSSNSSFEYPPLTDVLRVKPRHTVSSENVNTGAPSSTSSCASYLNNNNNHDKEEPTSIPTNIVFTSSDHGESHKLIQRRSACSRNATKSMEVEKKKRHEYDEVAIDDGDVILSNRVSTTSGVNPPVSSEDSSTSNNSCSSLTSRNSVVMEFDPLCQLQNNAAAAFAVSEREFTRSTSSPAVPPHTFRDNKNIDVAFKPTKTTSTTTTNSASFQNPHYFPVITANMDEMSRNIRSSVETEITEDDPIEPPVGLPDSSTPGSRTSTQSMTTVMERNVSPTISSSSEETTTPSNSSSPVNLAVAKVAESGSPGNFLRRLSHKMRLIPIKEEASLNHRGTDVTLASTSSLCPKCFEEHAENAKCKFSPVPRENIVYASALSKPSGLTKRDFVKRWAALSKGKLTFYSKRGETKTIDNISLDRVVLISKKDDHRVAPSQQDLKCFQLTLGNGKSSTMVLAGNSESERAAWMQKYIEVFTSSFPANIISSYDRAGWCFVKESVTSDWHPCWFILNGRKLYYAFHNGTNNLDEYIQVDLRKVRDITLGPKEEQQKCSYVDGREVLTIDLITKILYVQTENLKLTSSWEKAIRAAALFNGVSFDDMQLTTDNVPVIVDKCIAFLYAHGILSEGIYRQSGANSRIAGLLEDFRKDAWAVSLSSEEFSAHDVAGALKRFFRTLPEPLVTDKLYGRWISTFGITNQKLKLQEYRKLLDELPEINYNIMKKLMCHLYAVHELHEKNLMPLDNLAPIWGPTLMNVDILKCDGTEINDTSKLAQSYETALAECGVIRELIENYSSYTLFRVNSQEIEREKKIQLGLERFHLSRFQRKIAGDMRIYVHVHERDENSAISITLTPSATAAAIVEQIAKMTSQVRPYDLLALHEVIVSKSMERPLFPTEKVTETIFRWSIWDVEECKSNYLILKRNTLYPALIPYAKDPTLVYGDFKYADSKTKTFRKYAFEFSGAKLKYFKDAKATTEIESWNIEDIVWYIGAEKRRKETPTRFNFTFIPRTYKFKRSKDEPYFGNVVSLNTEEELQKFIAAMIIGEHPEGLYPSIIL